MVGVIKSKALFLMLTNFCLQVVHNSVMELGRDIAKEMTIMRPHMQVKQTFKENMEIDSSIV